MLYFSERSDDDLKQRVSKDLSIREPWNDFEEKMKAKLIFNWQKKNYQLNQVMIDSLEGLDVWKIFFALEMIRKVVRKSY